MIPRLVIASKNPDKIAEMKAILSEAGIAEEIVQDLDWEDVAETGSTLEENALLKARAVVEETGLPVVADDTGLEVEALDGAPGVKTARFAGDGARYDDNVAKMLQVMSGQDNRSARFRSVVVLAFPDGVEIVADGSVEGRITETERGTTGFGYDPIFEVDGKTLAEMSPEQKNELSHRARALQALVQSIKG